MKLILVTLAGLLFPTVLRPVGEGSPVALPHDTHVTTGRMLIEGNIATCQVRFFKDDLEQALGAQHGIEGFTIGVTEELDSLFSEYFDEAFLFRAGGELLHAEILSSGEEETRSAGTQQMVWWYMLQFEAPAPIREIGFSNRLLFNVFRDQRNIFKIIDGATNREHSFYFPFGDLDEQEISF